MENLKLMELLEQFKAETKQPAIRLTTRRSDHITPTNSKFGGLPYLPKNFAYPTDDKGNPLKLLAQLNFGELPPLADFPSEGILQFFVLADESIGTDGGDYKVIFHDKINENDQMTDFPEIKFVRKNLRRKESEWFPFEGEFLLTGELVDVPINWTLEEFGVELERFAESRSDVDFDELLEFAEDDSIFEPAEIHSIGGYPWFAQDDRRPNGSTLLFQMSSEFGSEIPEEDQIMWGDAGVANFFIDLADLRNLKFDDVLYNWDCG